MAKKKTLGPVDDFGFLLIGISCHAKDYRLCWALNGKLGIGLGKAGDLEVEKKGTKEKQSYSLYIFEDEENYRSYAVIANRCDAGLLVPEAKQVDYFLHVRGDVYDDAAAGLVESIRGLPLVQTAYRMDPNALKSKRNLLL